MNRRKKQIELCRKSAYLRSLKFDIENESAKEKVIKKQDEFYKKFLFYKGFNEAFSRR